ncbi:MAG: HlyD family type I secretion periplasmic adaptor subunit, partial [Leclercia adecarboxylata]|uniref:Membrane fusion protein (MFP) family protein n=1 Tax=Leclercia adecarboxylata TaxID=83655 RepID=A0AAP9D9N6_9ENTR|nr:MULTISPECIES: HlyD family type I secretion periplasmic adaptor subunit [Leclercia]MDU1062784.1 HlyD family type I secretion periplasmic adaptor subunit [Leclercia adecarboxylata]MDU1084347.1 HlyD family type I secretion periplasmic adaptor subunit [Leclercia adecarboxylata]MDU4840915.1 HlyD family type I secretion periplasmic adaptor subunit [Leclercia adecarboxylata]QDK17385.1 HlyD family type I secretion periplasmic adaptor subunit [Leclercia adecarboxylata]QGU16185.1 HlyD family type I s
MRIVESLSRLMSWLSGDKQPAPFTTNEVNKALLDDAPRVVRVTLWAILVFFIAMILWASLASIDEVTRGEGRAIPSSRLQKVQNLEGGIVAEVFVHEGEVVKAGAPLLRLDDTQFRSNAGETDADRLALQARIQRLTAQLNDATTLTLAPEIVQQAPDIASGEMELFTSVNKRIQSELAGLNEQLVQKKQELLDFQGKVSQYRRSLGLQQQEVSMSEPLVAKGAISKVEVLRLRRGVVETQGQLDSVLLAIPRAEAAIKEIESKVSETRGRYRSEALGQLNEARTDLSKIEASGKAITDRVNRTLVTSPVRGVVQQLLVNTIGGVIQPGNDLVEIVPLDDKLLVEAKIRPQDIAFLRPGQEATVKFTAYDYTIYGGLKGTLEQISPDTVTDKDGKSFYIIRLRTDKNHLGTDEKPLLIIPGMVASVDIITGKKTVMAYLLKPILRAKAEAFRER